MKTVRKDGSRQGAMKITALEPNSTLASQIGEHSPHFSATLRVGYSWLNEPVETWPIPRNCTSLLIIFWLTMPQLSVWFGAHFCIATMESEVKTTFKQHLLSLEPPLLKSQLEHARQKKDLSKRLVKKIRSESCFLNVLYFAFNCFVFCILWSYFN